MRGHPSRFASARFALLTLVGAPALLVAPEASATVVVLHSLAEMTARAEVIVHARVAEQRVVRENGRIVTLTEVEVIDAVKGAKPGEILTVYTVGGTLDGERTEVVGAYEYSRDEEMVFFGVRRGHPGQDRLISYGVGVGKFVVDRDEAGVKVVPAYGDVAVMGKGGRMSAPPPAEPRALDEFLAELKRHAANPMRIEKPRVRVPVSPTTLQRTPIQPRDGAPPTGDPGRPGARGQSRGER